MSHLSFSLADNSINILLIHFLWCLCHQYILSASTIPHQKTTAHLKPHWWSNIVRLHSRLSRTAGYQHSHCVWKVMELLALCCDPNWFLPAARASKIPSRTIIHWSIKWKRVKRHNFVSVVSHSFFWRSSLLSSCF